MSIILASIKKPEEGWPVLYHCKLCRCTTIVLSPWAAKPSDGDYWVVESCPDFWSHNVTWPRSSYYDGQHD